jgi:hypothetical protein
MYKDFGAISIRRERFLTAASAAPAADPAAAAAAAAAGATGAAAVLFMADFR